MKIDMSLGNKVLYNACEISEVGGRLSLTTPAEEAVNIVGRNIREIVAATPREERGSVTLTGPMAVWAYLAVFHAVVHTFGEVWYDDGRNPPVLIAKH